MEKESEAKNTETWLRSGCLLHRNSKVRAKWIMRTPPSPTTHSLLIFTGYNIICTPVFGISLCFAHKQSFGVLKRRLIWKYESYVSEGPSVDGPIRTGSESAMNLNVSLCVKTFWCCDCIYRITRTFAVNYLYRNNELLKENTSSKPNFCSMSQCFN